MPTGTTYHVTAGGKALDVYGGKKDAKTPIILYTPKPAQDNQQWTLRDAGKGMVTLVARNSGKCLDIRGGKAVQDDCGAAAQQWKMQASGGGFVLVSRDGKQALGTGGKEQGQQGLKLVSVKSGLVWSFQALG
ncbi:RICIN domain-containing protein [Yinghuangia sp. ASG 101]|uniref:RICIN domain-containing protein n=1 Tax=Yinghuangia sp. ASG 101 TaxID=2896848 RepID=UPI001E2EBADE|nr:RICIN domain-containing protein [Yinghuangia sp. ASG 101]UGQ09614.1 RICIN domain-containing protein [Yinghuangia sp. ASG 101]